MPTPQETADRIRSQNFSSLSTWALIIEMRFVTRALPLSPDVF